MLWRAALFAAIVTLGFVLVRFTPLAELLTEEKLVATFQALRRSWWAPILLIALYAFTAPLGLPMTPYVVGGAAVFGFAAGALYNMVGLLLGASSSYYLAKVLGRDFVVHVTRGKLRRVENAFERGGFWPLVQTRFMPLPFPLVNFGAALAGISPSLFLTTTTVGTVPATLIHTFFIARLIETSGQERWTTGVLYATVFVAFNLMIGFPSIRRWWRWRQRRREEATRQESAPR